LWKAERGDFGFGCRLGLNAVNLKVSSNGDVTLSVNGSRKTFAFAPRPAAWRPRIQVPDIDPPRPSSTSLAKEQTHLEEACDRCFSGRVSKQGEQVDLGTELVEVYRLGNLGRRAVCERAGIAVKLLDCYLRRDKDRLRKGQRVLPVVVTVEPEESKTAEITVVVGNGRRVEVQRSAKEDLPWLSSICSLLHRCVFF
jgi:hypothetical protein